MPSPPKPPPDSLLAMGFPTGGIDVSTEFELQPPDTTPAGVNVRAFDPDTDRMRGGGRHGLTEAIPAQVNGTNSIQQIDTIVITDPIVTGGGVLGAAGGSADDGMGGYTGIGGYGPTKNVSRPSGNSYWFNNRQMLPLEIIAANQNKNFADTFTFTGAEFIFVGLQGADSITSCSFICRDVTNTIDGTQANVPGATFENNPYIITPSNAIGVGLTRYNITYTTGEMQIGFQCKLRLGLAGTGNVFSAAFTLDPPGVATSTPTATITSGATTCSVSAAVSLDWTTGITTITFTVTSANVTGGSPITVTNNGQPTGNATWTTTGTPLLLSANVIIFP